MQATKDSFYMTLRARLQEANPQRTAMIGGVSRPAIMVLENECLGEDAELNDTYCLNWGAPASAEAGGSLQVMTCTVSYQTRGTGAAAGTDRGRVLSAMDMELAEICLPPIVGKMDYTVTPAVPLSSNLFWSAPVFADAEMDGQVIRRRAAIKIFFVPEGA